MAESDLTPSAAIDLLFGDLPRQGPGEASLCHAILDRLPDLPAAPRIVDMGCGTGAGSLLLAKRFQAPVVCVDQSTSFLASLKPAAAQAALGHLIQPLRTDMSQLDARTYQFDLLWSEGAAYNLTFPGALKIWRPLLPKGAYAVISEMSWFSELPPEPAQVFWSEAYPQMGREAENLSHLAKHEFRALFTERLPAAAWWSGYYDPLANRMAQLNQHPSAVMQEILAEIRLEMDLFRAHSDHYGYCYYVLQAI